MVVAVFDYLMHPNGFLFRIQLRVTLFSVLVFVINNNVLYL